MRDQHFQTRITDLFSIQHPILAGGLMWLADARYVAAVVNAGAMGFVSARTFPDLDRFQAELRSARELTLGKPFGVNLHLSAQGQGNDLVERLLEVALTEGIRHFETSGLPPTKLVARIRAVAPESVIVHKVASIRHAISSERKLEIDAVAVVGAECGGHPGLDMVGSMVQAPLAPQRLRLPVLIGGGIGTGSQLAACLAMGAEGVVIGTRFLVAEELWSHTAVKQRVVECGETDTRLVLASQRNTYRCMANETAASVADLDDAGVQDLDEYRPYIRGTLQREAYEVGDWNLGILSMGQGCAFADRIEPVEAIIDRLIDGATASTARLAALRGRPEAPSVV